jgi:hypothetical protein
LAGEIIWEGKGAHEPARAGLGASHLSARENMARLGLARCAFGPEKWARPELATNSVQLELARDNTENSPDTICATKSSK